MCILFEICEKRPLQKVWVRAGQVLTFFSTELHSGRCTQTCTAQFHHVFSESSSSFAGRAGTPLEQTWPCLWTGTYFFNFPQMLQPAFLSWHPPCVKRHSPQTISCEVHVWLLAQPDLGSKRLFGLPGSCRSTGIDCAPQERALLCTKGFCGASGDATAWGVNL